MKKLIFSRRTTDAPEIENLYDLLKALWARKPGATLIANPENLIAVVAVVAVEEVELVIPAVVVVLAAVIENEIYAECKKCKKWRRIIRD